MSAFTPLRILIVEDEAVLAMELENLCEEAGHEVIGWATCQHDCTELLDGIPADLAFVDLHLADGLTGMEIGQQIRTQMGAAVIYMTANPTLLPEGLFGAYGVIAKPYSMSGVVASLAYLTAGIRQPPPTLTQPGGLTLAPMYDRLWHA